ncbi:pirin family protein [Pseudomonas nunensis]|uniref:pirin family protein n=1 Tax=Pseudomonas nunensis TaxID=2961896 RepID=UPI000AE86D4D|nr:pirin family protein [Pseudomonas nunensis]
MNSLSARLPDNTRRISHSTRGHGHGPIVRLMSPSDFGQLLKPFVFLDLFETDLRLFGSMPLHPHSGIATITVITEGNLRFDDPDSGTGLIGYGGVEWMRAGAGVWHGKELSAGTSSRVQGFQLWIALPAELELAPVDSQYIEADAMPHAGPARVILGEYQDARSPVRAPSGITYLLVTLAAGQRWEYQPPAGHDVLWLSVSRGTLRSPEPILEGELVAFEPGNGALTLEAGDQGDAVFVLGSAVPHHHELKMGSYSVHTSVQALNTGEANIQRLGERLRAQSSPEPGTRSTPIYK